MISGAGGSGWTAVGEGGPRRGRPQARAIPGEGGSRPGDLRRGWTEIRAVSREGCHRRSGLPQAKWLQTKLALEDTAAGVASCSNNVHIVGHNRIETMTQVPAAMYVMIENAYLPWLFSSKARI